MTKYKKYKMVDLFAGCGGLSKGLELASFSPWFVNEIIEQYCNTYKVNHKLTAIQNQPYIFH
ncbi:MAG: DNA cytosine methyltransferase [Bacteroidales bacterium]|nr:DNA cytosine methyltransferase [Bacteroidales bacterium]